MYLFSLPILYSRHPCEVSAEIANCPKSTSEGLWTQVFLMPNSTLTTTWHQPELAICIAEVYYFSWPMDLWLKNGQRLWLKNGQRQNYMLSLYACHSTFLNLCMTSFITPFFQKAQSSVLPHCVLTTPWCSTSTCASLKPGPAWFSGIWGEVFRNRRRKTSMPAFTGPVGSNPLNPSKYDLSGPTNFKNKSL